METKIRETRREIYDNLTGVAARANCAAHTTAIRARLSLRCFTEWGELHGDRRFADDKAMPSG